MILITGTRSKGFFTEPTPLSHFPDLKIQGIKTSTCVYKTQNRLPIRNPENVMTPKKQDCSFHAIYSTSIYNLVMLMILFNLRVCNKQTETVVR